MNDYVLTKPHVFEVTDSEGKKTFCVKGKIQYADKKKKARNPRTDTLFPGDIEGFISDFRALLPKTGKWTDDSGEEHDWCGLKEPELDASGNQKPFTLLDYKAVCDYLFDEGYTDYSNGIWRTVPFEQPMVQLYSQNLGKKKNSDGSFTSEPLYKAGEPVCFAGTKTVYVYREIEVFVRVEKEGVDYRTDVPMAGWGWMQRRKSAERMYMPLSAFIEKQKTDSNLATYDIQASDMPGASRQPEVFDPDNANAPEV
jgi:hypothetical protein